MINQKLQNLTSLLQNQYRNKFPQVFSAFEQLKNGNSDPMGILGQVTSKFSPQQMQGFMQTARQFGVPDTLLNQIQNGINTK